MKLFLRKKRLFFIEKRGWEVRLALSFLIFRGCLPRGCVWGSLVVYDKADLFGSRFLFNGTVGCAHMETDA